MAEGGSGLLDQEHFGCVICLDLLKDPVTIPCGHNYCMGCIKGRWDQDDHTGIYSCPKCKETFTPRPVLNKNRLLADCIMYNLRGHDTVSAAAERTEKQKQLRMTQNKFQQRIQGRENELQDLRKTVLSLKRSTRAAVEDSERIFIELISSIKRRCSEVKKRIRDQEKAEVNKAEGLLERLEQEIAELRRRDAELAQLSHSDDHILFLQDCLSVSLLSCQSLCVSPGSRDLPTIPVNPHVPSDAVRKSVSDLRQEDIYK